MKTLVALSLLEGIRALQLSGERLPAKLAYALNLNARNLEPIEKSYNEIRSQLIEKHADRDEAGAMVRVPNPQGGEAMVSMKEGAAAFNEDNNAIAETPVRVGIHKIDLSAFGDVTINGATMYKIAPMIRAPADDVEFDEPEGAPDLPSIKA